MVVTVSHLLVGTLFIKDDDNYSNTTFQQFRQNREIIANRQAINHTITVLLIVLISIRLSKHFSRGVDTSFFRAYSGKTLLRLVSIIFQISLCPIGELILMVCVILSG